MLPYTMCRATSLCSIGAHAHASGHSTCLFGAPPVAIPLADLYSLISSARLFSAAVWGWGGCSTYQRPNAHLVHAVGETAKVSDV